ncbi:MAG: DUF2169 domain-containing protein [bacterium]
MEIINQTPFEAVWLFGKGPEKKEIVTVIVKGTFDLVNEQVCSVATRQLPIFESDQLYKKPEASAAEEEDKEKESSVKVEGDYVLFKPKTDVVLHGKAYAPGGSASQCDVIMKIGSYQNTIRVFGNRKWIPIPNMPFSTPESPPGDFTTIELKYENALGGPDFSKNPTGKGHYKNPIEAVGQPLPNLEDPENLIQVSVNLNKITPKCFGWYGRAWPQRRDKAGDIANSAPELPDDFNWEFNNGASPDLIVPYLNGDEEIVLTNCEPVGLFKFRLPGITPNVAVDFGLGAEPVDMVLDTVCIMMETNLEVEGEETKVEKQAYLVWRGKTAIDATHRLEKIKKIVID